VRKGSGASPSLETCHVGRAESNVVNMKTAEHLAVEQLQFALDNDSLCFNKPQAELFGITEQEQFVKVASFPDIYDLLDGTYNFENFIGISVHTTGWAAPLNENGEVDGAPSEHAERRRVSLITTVTNEGSGSALAFADDEGDHEIVSDPGSASGTLAEAIVNCWLRSKGEI
jgi:hypothetical protein